MYTSFHIRNFRGFDDLKLDDLARVNLIAGKNNVGKTALLEALFIHSGCYNPELALRLNAFRGIPRIQIDLARWAVAPWDALFKNFDTTQKIEFSSLNSKNQEWVLHLNILSDPDELRKFVINLQQDSNGSGSSSSFTDPFRVLQLHFEDKERSEVVDTHVFLDHSGVNTEIVPSPPFQTSFLGSRGRTPLDEDANNFTKLASSGKRDLLLDALTILEPNLRTLELLKFGGATMLHGDTGINRPIPLAFMGDGLTRIANIILAIGNAPSGVVLIDEIENGLHYSVLKDIWKAIAKAAREFDTQIFATTHSWECITAAHRAFAEESMYDFRYLRLERSLENESIHAVGYDQETLDATIEMNLEAR